MILGSLILIPLVLGYFILMENQDKKNDYKKCLENIDRLERELYPEYFSEPKRTMLEEMDYGPGAVWALPAGADIRPLHMASSGTNQTQLNADLPRYLLAAKTIPEPEYMWYGKK